MYLRKYQAELNFCCIFTFSCIFNWLGSKDMEKTDERWLSISQFWGSLSHWREFLWLFSIMERSVPEEGCRLTERNSDEELGAEPNLRVLAWVSQVPPMNTLCALLPLFPGSASARGGSVVLGTWLNALRMNGENAPTTLFCCCIHQQSARRCLYKNVICMQKLRHIFVLFVIYVTIRFQWIMRIFRKLHLSCYWSIYSSGSGYII